MAKRVDIKNVPEELFAALIEIGKARRETVPATMLRLCSDSVFGPSGVRLTSVSDPSHVRPRTETKKFKPPTVEEEVKHTREECHEATARLGLRYVNPDKFFEWYDEFGWYAKGSKKPLDLDKAARRWDRKEKEKQEAGNGTGKKLNYAEQRFQDNVDAFNSLFPMAGEAGDKAGGGVERTSASTALVRLRREPD
jgi:hypothetical protein